PADYRVRCEGGDAIEPMLYNAVGGSTVGFNANYWRLAPSDFRVRSLDGVAVDWPISYEELAPYYAANEREVGVAGLAGDPCGPAREPLPLPPAPVGRTGERLIEGAERLGWYWWPTEKAIATAPHLDRPGCDNRGWCSYGCPRASLSSADVTYWPRALRNGVELQTGSRVREIEIGADGRALGAVYHDAQGRTRRGRASPVVAGVRGRGA